MSDADIEMVDLDARRADRVKLAQDYLLQELPGFRNYVEFVQDPFGISIRVRSAIPFEARSEATLIPMRLDPHDRVLKEHVDRLIEHTRGEAIRMLGLEPQIEKRVEEGTRKEIARQKAEIERAAYERGLEAGVSLALRAKKDADEALDRIEGDMQ